MDKPEKIDKEECLRRIQEDEDFISSKKYGYSLANFLKKKPEGAPDKTISEFLMCSTKTVNDIYESAVASMRKHLGLDN